MIPFLAGESFIGALGVIRQSARRATEGTVVTAGVRAAMAFQRRRRAIFMQLFDLRDRQEPSESRTDAAALRLARGADGTHVR